MTGLIQLDAFVHIPHSFSQVLFGSSDVCGASPHVFECVQAAKGRYLVFTERGDHSIDAVNGSLCVVWRVVYVHLCCM